MEIFDLQFFKDVFLILLKYIPVTIYLTFYSALLSLILAFIIGILRYYKVPVLYPILSVYVSIFRGTPLIVQLFIVYYGLPRIFPILVSLDPKITTVLALGLHFAAYMSESIRSSINSIDKGQFEAAYSVGMTEIQTLRRIVLPQATRIAIPTIFNNLMDILKSTSLAFLVGVTEIMAAAKKEASGSFKFFESYVAVGILYWLINIILEQVGKYIENKYKFGNK